MSDKSKIQSKIVFAKDEEQRAKKSGALNLQREKLGKQCFATTRTTRHAIWYMIDSLGFMVANRHISSHLLDAKSQISVIVSHHVSKFSRDYIVPSLIS